MALHRREVCFGLLVVAGSLTAPKLAFARRGGLFRILSGGLVIFRAARGLSTVFRVGRAVVSFFSDSGGGGGSYYSSSYSGSRVPVVSLDTTVVEVDVNQPMSGDELSIRYAEQLPTLITEGSLPLGKGALDLESDGKLRFRDLGVDGYITVDYNGIVSAWPPQEVDVPTVILTREGENIHILCNDSALGRKMLLVLFGDEVKDVCDC